MRQNDQARAENEFKAALNLDPKSSEAYAALGTLYWSRNDLKAAEQAFKTRRRSRPRAIADATTICGFPRLEPEPPQRRKPSWKRSTASSPIICRLAFI